MEQPREFRIIAWVGGIALLVTAVAFASNLIANTTHRLEPNAVNKIKDLCGYRAECKVRAGDIFPGDWDGLYTFGAGASQAEVDAALGRGKARAVSGERGRMLVLTNNGKVIRQEVDATGNELPLANQIEFLDRDRNVVMHGRFTQDTWLWASAAKIHPDALQSDTYYVLSPDDLSPSSR